MKISNHSRDRVVWLWKFITLKFKKTREESLVCERMELKRTSVSVSQNYHIPNEGNIPHSQDRWNSLHFPEDVLSSFSFASKGAVNEDWDCLHDLVRIFQSWLLWEILHNRRGANGKGKCYSDSLKEQKTRLKKWRLMLIWSKIPEWISKQKVRETCEKNKYQSKVLKSKSCTFKLFSFSFGGY